MYYDILCHIIYDTTVYVQSITIGVPLYGGGNIKRTFTHMADLCYQIVMASELSESNGNIYNIGGETLTLCEAAQIIARPYNVKVVDTEWPEKDLRIESNHTYFDDRKIKTLLGNIEYKKLSTIDF